MPLIPWLKSLVHKREEYLPEFDQHWQNELTLQGHRSLVDGVINKRNAACNATAEFFTYSKAMRAETHAIKTGRFQTLLELAKKCGPACAEKLEKLEQLERLVMSARDKQEEFYNALTELNATLGTKFRIPNLITEWRRYLPIIFGALAMLTFSLSRPGNAHEDASI